MKGKTMIDNIWQDAQIQRGGVFGEMHLARGGFDFAFSGRLDFNKAVANNPDAAFLALYPDVTSEYVGPNRLVWVAANLPDKKHLWVYGWEQLSEVPEFPSVTSIFFLLDSIHTKWSEIRN